MANAQSITDVTTSHADLLAYLLECERQETSSSPLSLTVDQLSNTDARIEAVEKSISELHKRLTKDTEIRQEQQSEVVTLIAKNAAATELIKLAVNRLNGLFASKLLSEASTEANHEYCSDNELAKACEKKADSETRRATHSSELSSYFDIQRRRQRMPVSAGD